jgi:molybdate transport system ATP-binding protein
MIAAFLLQPAALLNLKYASIARDMAQIFLLEPHSQVRLELACGTERLIVQIVPDSMRELEIEEGREVVAVINTSAFRRLV